ncbi:hypothetical protein JP0118_04270 [Helicobacter pylori]|nr:hypothetical protein JP0118_04270 [Helicobacter pylori]
MKPKLYAPGKSQIPLVPLPYEQAYSALTFFNFLKNGIFKTHKEIGGILK